MACSSLRRRYCLKGTPDHRVHEQSLSKPPAKVRAAPVGICGRVKAMLRVRMFGLTLLATLAISCLCAIGAQARWGKDYLPNATVVTQDGKTLQFYDDLIRDKIFVISFLFTT